MSIIPSVVDKESEYNRIHSYLEFIVHPEHLDTHCEKLKNGTERFPSAFDLMKTFLTEAADMAASPKQTVLHQLAARIVKIMNLDLETIEKEIPTRLQRRLTYEVAQSDPAGFGLFHLRWGLRVMINYPHPEPLLKDMIKEDVAEKQQPSADVSPAIPVITEDAIFSQLLPKCLSSDVASSVELSLLCFELFELAFSVGKYEICQQLSKILSDGAAKNLSDLQFSRYQALLQVTQSLISAPAESLAPQMALNDILRRLKGSLEDKNKLYDHLIDLLHSDIPANEIGFTNRDMIVLESTILPRFVISKCAAMNILAAWFHSGGSSRVLMSNLKSLWTGALVKVTDEKSDIESTLALLASRMMVLVDPLRSQIGQTLFDDITTHLLRLLAWSVQSISAEEFGNIIEKNASSLGYLLPKVTSRMRYLIQESQNLSFFELKTTLVDAKLTEATHARSVSAAADAITRLAGSDTGLKKSLMMHKIGEYLTHRSFVDAANLFQLCKQTPDPFLASTAGLCANLANHADNTAIQHSILQIQSALKEANSDQQLFDTYCGHLIAILTEENQIELLHHACLPVPELRFAAICCDIVSFCKLLLQSNLGRSADAMDVDTDTNGASPSSLAATLENITATLREQDINSILNLLRSWRHYESARSICCILSHLVVFLQQSADAVVDFVPSRFGNELTEALESVGLLQFLHKNVKGSPSSLLKRDIEPKIRQILSVFTKQLLELNPADYLAQIALGDELYRAQKYSRALRLYLSAGCVESGFWTDVGMPDAFNYVLKRVIVCLKQIKSYAAAAILGQFVSPPDWAESIRLIHDHLDSFKEVKLLHFVWELPLLEHLAHEFHRNDLPHLAQIVVSIIGRPEMNEMANPNIRKKMIYSQKKHFLLLLSQEASSPNESLFE